MQVISLTGLGIARFCTNKHVHVPLPYDFLRLCREQTRAHINVLHIRPKTICIYILMLIQRTAYSTLLVNNVVLLEYYRFTIAMPIAFHNMLRLLVNSIKFIRINCRVNEFLFLLFLFVHKR